MSKRRTRLPLQQSTRVKAPTSSLIWTRTFLPRLRQPLPERRFQAERLCLGFLQEQSMLAEQPHSKFLMELRQQLMCLESSPEITISGEQAVGHRSSLMALRQQRSLTYLCLTRLLTDKYQLGTLAEPSPGKQSVEAVVVTSLQSGMLHQAPRSMVRKVRPSPLIMQEATALLITTALTSPSAMA